MGQTQPPLPPVGYVNATSRNGYLTATLADDGPSGHVYRIKDERGYTHREDTVRVVFNEPDETYEVTTLRPAGWTFLLDGTAETAKDARIGGLRRAFRVLFGEENHG